MPWKHRSVTSRLSRGEHGKKRIRSLAGGVARARARWVLPRPKAALTLSVVPASALTARILAPSSMLGPSVGGLAAVRTAVAVSASRVQQSQRRDPARLLRPDETGDPFLAGGDAHAEGRRVSRSRRVDGSAKLSFSPLLCHAIRGRGAIEPEPLGERFEISHVEMNFTGAGRRIASLIPQSAPTRSTNTAPGVS